MSFNDAIEGLVLFCSISDISPLVTPALAANFRCDKPCSVLSSFNRKPISILKPLPSNSYFVTTVYTQCCAVEIIKHIIDQYIKQ